MYPYILCFCGRALGDVYDAYKLLRLLKYEAAYGEDGVKIDPAYLAITEAVFVDMSDVLAALGIHSICCRTRMTTQVEISTLW